MILYKILADTTVFIHFFWILFLFLRALLGVRNKVIMYTHLCGLLFAILIQILGWYCPLTHLEFWLRSRHNSSIAYVGSFIIHYLERLVNLEISPIGVLQATIGLIIFNSWLYLRKR